MGCCGNGRSETIYMQYYFNQDGKSVGIKYLSKFAFNTSFGYLLKDAI